MLTSPEFKQFRVDFAQAVKGLETKYNMKIELGSITYSQTNFHVKLTGTKINAEGKKLIDTTHFNMLKQIYNFKGNIGDTFVSDGKIFTVINIDSKKRKNNVILSASDGKQYVSTPESVNRMLKLA